MKRPVRSTRCPTRKRVANPAKNDRVNLAAHLPGVPPLWGTLKTIGGLRVVEVSPDVYLTPDLEVEATRSYLSRGDYFSGWIVRCERDRSYSDSIPTKAEALQVMVDWPRPRSPR
jgi:hypothetical protein